MKKIPLLKKLKMDFPDYSDKELFALILCGEVQVAGQVIKDPKAVFPVDAEIVLRQKRYVSRGGLKLEKALEIWSLPVKGKVLLDAGCSTGGFTDCLLQHGAAGVYAVDVGFNQLDYSLRNNPAVTVMEKTNIMHVETLDPVPDWAVADLSFRSIRSAASHILHLTRDGVLIALVKPQFEWSNPDDEFKGIVKDQNTILEIAGIVMEELAEEGAYVLKATISPVSGRKGNQELLFWIVSSKTDSIPDRDELLDLLEKELRSLS